MFFHIFLTPRSQEHAIFLGLNQIEFSNGLESKAVLSHGSDDYRANQDDQTIDSSKVTSEVQGIIDLPVVIHHFMGQF